jgi:recombination protein RecA
MKTIEEDILSEFGDYVLTAGQSIIDSDSKVISLSPAADLKLGGGIPEGSFCVFTGPPKSGKTVTAFDFAATAQQIEYACAIGRKEGRHVFYSNIEGRLKKRDLLGIHHLNINPDRFTVIQSQPGKILSGEDYIDINERLINAHPGDVFIIDSFSALCTAGEMKADIADRYRADSPLLLARFCRRISNVIPINKSIVIGITHQIANQGQGMATWVEASGRKIQYQTDVKLKATHFSPWNAGEKQIGQDTHWQCDSSALNTPPGGKFDSKIKYGYGIDKEAELILLGIDLSLVQKGGAWLTIGKEKVQGIEKAALYLRENPSIYKEMYDKMKEMMGI